MVHDGWLMPLHCRMALEWVLVFNQPGPHLSQQRKMLRRSIGPQRVGSHDEKIEQNATRLMLELKTFEGNPNPLIIRSVSAVELKEGLSLIEE